MSVSEIKYYKELNILCKINRLSIVLLYWLFIGSSGAVTFENVAGAKYRLRVIAGDNHAVIRTRVLLMPDTPNFCSLNAINDGVTEVLDSNGEVSSYILEFRPIGRDVGFVCIINRNEEPFNCECVHVLMDILC